MVTAGKTFLSYARADADFALHLATDLRAAGVNLWVDQLDIPKGAIWDQEVEKALQACSHVLIVLSPTSVNSHNAMDEVSFALEEEKTVIPVLFQPCNRPFRLRRLQYVDFTGDYRNGLSALTHTLPRGPDLRDSGIDTVSSPNDDMPDKLAQLEKGVEKREMRGEGLQQPAIGERASLTPTTLSPSVTELEVAEERILHDTKRILCVAFSPTGEMIASGGGNQGFIFSSDFTIRLWRVVDGEQLMELSLHKTEVNYLAFSPDGATLASSSSEAVRLWRMPDGKLLRTLEDEKNVYGFGPIAFSPDGELLAAGAHLWRVSDGERLRPIPGGEPFRDGSDIAAVRLRTLFGFGEFAFSQNWAMIARRSKDKNIRVLRVADGKSILTTEMEVWDLAFSPDGSMLALSWNDKKDNQVVIFSIHEGTKRIVATGMGGGIIEFSNDGTLLAFGAQTSGDVRIWRVADMQLLAKWKLPEKGLSANGVHSITFAPNDSWLAAGCEDKTIRLWPLQRYAPGQVNG